MKKIVVLSFLAVIGLLPCMNAVAQNAFDVERTLYIVRHAEKDTSGGNNPVLSDAGKHRAGDLYRELISKKIDLIMTTQYRRTGMTADSVRLYMKVDTLMYKADATGEDFLKTLNEGAGDAKNILVVGHSNTLPAIIRQAGIASFTIKELSEAEFDNLFVVKQKKGSAVLEQKKYGKRS